MFACLKLVMFEFMGMKQADILQIYTWSKVNSQKIQKVGMLCPLYMRYTYLIDRSLSLTCSVRMRSLQLPR